MTPSTRHASPRGRRRRKSRPTARPRGRAAPTRPGRGRRRRQKIRRRRCDAAGRLDPRSSPTAGTAGGPGQPVRTACRRLGRRRPRRRRTPAAPSTRSPRPAPPRWQTEGRTRARGGHLDAEPAVALHDAPAPDGWRRARSRRRHRGRECAGRVRRAPWLPPLQRLGLDGVGRRHQPVVVILDPRGRDRRRPSATRTTQRNRRQLRHRGTGSSAARADVGSIRATSVSARAGLPAAGPGRDEVLDRRLPPWVSGWPSPESRRSTTAAAATGVTSASAIHRFRGRMRTRPSRHLQPCLVPPPGTPDPRMFQNHSSEPRPEMDQTHVDSEIRVRRRLGVPLRWRRPDRGGSTMAGIVEHEDAGFLHRGGLRLGFRRTRPAQSSARTH